jgi:thermopsin
MTARNVFLAVLVVTVTVSALAVGVVGARPVASSPVGTSALATGPTTAPSHLAPSPASASRLALEQRILAQSKADHIPMEAVSLPNLLGQSKASDGVITPSTTVAPAPMGLGAYGVMNTTGTASAFSFTSSSWEGSITLNSVNTFLLDNDGAISTNGADNTFGVQLNAVMEDVTLPGSSTNAFWTQNVLYFNFPVPGYITFLDNVWNFSSPAINLASGTLYSYNGTPVYPSYYYDFGPSFPLTMPLTVHLYLNESTTDDMMNGYGYSTVRFGYNVVNPTTGVSEENGVYDTVEFNSTTPFASVPASPYLVDGSQYTPTGFIPWDAEIMIGGPGGGTTTSIYGISGSESLQYWDATSSSYVNPAAAWNLGSETGETSEGIAETYTSPGTVLLSAGPSIPAPLWGSTPGGNIGQATFSGPLSPSNAFVFFTPGNGFDPNYAAWAPTQTANSVNYVLPPGTYTVTAMLSDYNPIQKTVTVSNGAHARLSLDLHQNFARGVYTPLFAWDNAQLAAISRGGSGSSWQPYVLVNNPAPGGLNPVFGEFNDYLYQVFPGVLLAGISAHVDLDHPSLLNVTYPTSYWPGLASFGLPNTNNLQFELFDSSNISIWGAQGITGWFFFEDYGPTGLLPLANVVVWGGTHDLVGDNTFESQGSALVLAGVDPSAPTGNVVWGNTFVDSTALSPAMYPGDGVVTGPPIGIFAFESGDLIYNNWVGTSITAYAPNANMFTGAPQLNLENWNLSMVEPWYDAMSFNGFWLYGTIVPSYWQGGNFWADYTPGSGLPYDEFGYIAAGGDYFPLPIVVYAVVFELSAYGHHHAVEWSVTLNGVTQTTYGSEVTFFETPGTYTYTDAVVHGSGSITPSGGTLTVVSHAIGVHLRLS